MTAKFKPLSPAQVNGLLALGVVSIAAVPETQGGRARHEVVFSHDPVAVVAEISAEDFNTLNHNVSAIMRMIAFPGCEAALYLTHQYDANARNFQVREVNVDGNMVLQYVDRPNDPIV